MPYGTAHTAVPEPIEFNGKTITPQNLYTTLFVIGTLLEAVSRSTLIRSPRSPPPLFLRALLDLLLARRLVGMYHWGSRWIS